MKKHRVLFLWMALSSIYGTAQTNNELFSNNSRIKYVSGQGLQVNFDDGNYLFGIRGFFQPFFSTEQVDTLERFSRMTLERARLDFYGEAKKERLSFMLKMDYTDDFALLDAYMGFHPGPFNIYMGQKHNQVNNREMNNDEGYLTFLNRSLVSTTFSRDAREFGLFIEPSFNVGGIVVNPVLSLTSGDGRNAFGADSRERIQGGFKYAARVDLLPFGEFADNGQHYIQDLAREMDFKLAIGAAANRNVEATHEVGEGSGDFLFRDENGDNLNANYDQLYIDVLAKYQGFSALVEYVSTRAQASEAIFTQTGTPITDENIASFYALGDGINAQLGYLMSNGLSADVRFTQIMPEFEVANSLVQEQTQYTFSVGWYSQFRAFKVQYNGAYTEFSNVVEEGVNVEQTGWMHTLMTQIRF
ncbi:MAG: hypothetical protein AAGA85_20640 [Bacteroidota bacterium]